MEPTVPRARPAAECDVVMKGGITSGVVYPRALTTLAASYRFRGIGGASAGAIGAAMGAAAEYGRAGGGFDRLHALPAELYDGRLAELFQPEEDLRPLFDLMLLATSDDPGGAPATPATKVCKGAAILARAFPLAGVLGGATGLALAAIGALRRGVAGVLLVPVGVVLAALGWLVGVGSRVYRLFTVDLPANRFGLCSGTGASDDHPGFTDWMAHKIDELAGVSGADAPLTFGHLWRGGPPGPREQPREIDLRLITTCLTEGRPFELPLDARRFFYDPEEWRLLFPAYVVDALLAAPTARGDEQVGDPDDDLTDAADDRAESGRPGGGGSEDAVGQPTRADAEWQWETEQAHRRGLRRLPDAEHLPVIVATRLSLSFPLLISAMPLYTVNRADPRNHHAYARRDDPQAPGSLVFARVWFTDGGFCSNFPVQLFDSALPSRPTFAINLGSFPVGRSPEDDQTRNIEWATTNRSGLLPPYTEIPETGPAAVLGFASAAFNTARNWQDSSHLDHPGYRDRIVRVLQTKDEGGMNLRMSSTVIDGLTERGRVAAQVMVDQFTNPHYPNGATGWDNHRWVRYRALLSVLPDWAASYKRGAAVLAIDPNRPPAYRLSPAEQQLAAGITASLDQLAAGIEQAAKDDPAVVRTLTDAPRPRGRLRRIPQI